MTKLRWQLGGLLAWIWLLSALRALGAGGLLSPGLSLYALVVTLIFLSVPRAARSPRRWLAVPPVVVLGLVGRPEGVTLQARLPEIVVDLGALLLTIQVAAPLALGLQEYSEALGRLLLSGRRRRSRPFRSVQRELYREVRRARLSRQPLTVLAISPCRPEGATVPRHLVEEAMRAVGKEYTYGCVLELLCEKAKNCDLIARLNNHLVTVLPLMAADDAAETAQRLREEARGRLGVHLAIGMASFPEEEVTLVGLLERAVGDMRRHLPQERSWCSAEAEADREGSPAAAGGPTLRNAPIDSAGESRQAAIEGCSGSS